jgi:hypothetical protein
MITWYISTTGSDSAGNGSIGNPYATIAKCIEVSTNGDTISILNGTYTITSTTTITKQVTVTSNSDITASVVFDSNCTIFNIQSSNVVIEYVTLQTSSVDPVISIDRLSTGPTAPTFFTNNSITNCNIKYTGTALSLNGSYTINSNIFTRHLGSNVCDIIKIYSTRGNSSVSSNTFTDSGPVRYVMYFTSTGSGSYLDYCNSKGGSFTIASNTVNMTHDQSTTLVYFDYFNQYTFVTSPNIHYNNNTKIALLVNNNVINSTAKSKVIVVMINSDSDLNTFGICNINTNTINNTDYGVLHLDKNTSSSSIVTIQSSELTRNLFKIYSNLLYTSILSPIITTDTSLMFWLDASDVTTLYQNDLGTTPVTTNGQYVRLIKDKSSKENHLKTNDPNTINSVYDNSTGKINNNSVVKGLNAGLFMNFNTPNMLVGANGCTFIFVFKHIANMNSVAFTRINVYGDTAWIGYGEVLYENLGFTQRHPINFNNGDLNNAYIYALVADSTTNTKLYKNKDLVTPVFSGTYGSATFSVNQQIGYSTFGAKLSFCEMILYNKAMSETTTPKLSEIVDYLGTKWGI